MFVALYFSRRKYLKPFRIVTLTFKVRSKVNQVQTKKCMLNFLLFLSDVSFCADIFHCTYLVMLISPNLFKMDIAYILNEKDSGQI